MNFIKLLLRHGFRSLSGPVLITIFTLALIVAQMIHGRDFRYGFLIWNLFLAWIPVWTAFIWIRRLEYPAPLSRFKSLALFGFWLLFFPNAPYLITDLIHINERFLPAGWMDSIIFFMSALTGLTLGVLSLHYVERSLSWLFSTRLTRAILVGSILLSGYGIYLGRVERWNSWDLFTNPVSLATNMIMTATQPMAIQMTLAFSSLILVIYILFKWILLYEKR